MHARIQENPYLNLTPMALRRSIGMIGMLRQAAQAEAEYALYVADRIEDLNVGSGAALRGTADGLYALDAALMSTALNINDCCIAYCDELTD